MNVVPITKKGELDLRGELNQLTKHDRPRIIAAIAEARAHGDLKENAEYHAAREEQGFIEARIRDIESKLSNCRVIDLSNLTNEGRVVFGARVSLVNIDNDEAVSYQIVGVDEADIKVQKISVTSPLARALISKSVGDIVDVAAPQGQVSYEIIQVDYI